MVQQDIMPSRMNTWPHRDAFKNYVRSIVLRNNTLTGRLYRDDPAILAWDLVNEPFNYGDDSGKVMTVSILIARLTFLTSILAQHAF